MRKDNSFYNNLILCLKCKKSDFSVSSSQIKCNKCLHYYDVVEGIPILIDESKNDSSYHLMDKRSPDPNIHEKNSYGIYKFVEKNIKGTSGYLYKNDVLKKYPIPNIDINSNNLSRKLFLDIGCGWGRWTISSAHSTEISIGVDVSIDSLICAKNIAKELNLNCFFIYADIRNLPLKKNIIDIAYSYSVFQHLSSQDFFRSIKSIYSVLGNKGEIHIQIMNKFALRNLFVQLKRNFKKPVNFEVRYHSYKRLFKPLSRFFKNIKITNCSFFTQARLEDFNYLTTGGKFIILVSLILNSVSRYLNFLKYLSDNIYVSGKKFDKSKFYIK